MTTIQNKEIKKTPYRLKLLVEFLKEPVESTLKMKFRDMGDFLKLKPYLNEIIEYKTTHADKMRIYFMWSKLRFELVTRSSIEDIERMYTIGYEIAGEKSAPPGFFIEVERRAV